jgi:hypothetical protein
MLREVEEMMEVPAVGGHYRGFHVDDHCGWW